MHKGGRVVVVIIFRTFSDVVAAMRKAGGSITGNLVLADSRVISLKANEVDPEIELEIQEERIQSSATSPHDLSTGELLQLLSDAPGSLG